jgi:tetratricopeptide (TPR) repeat protein
MQAGDRQGAVEAYRRAAKIEPLFWPAVFNLYSALERMNDQKGMQELIDQTSRVGADYLAIAARMESAFKKGNLAEAVNLGLAYWKTGRKDARAAIAGDLWVALLQLGFVDEASHLGPAPDFAPAMWRLDPKGLDLMESHHMDAKTFFSLQPLTENASRLYLLSGRGKTLADMYLSLNMTPDASFRLMHGDVPDVAHFLYSAPLIALALKQNGHAEKAQALLSLAESSAKQQGGQLPDDAVLLARVYAVQGRKEEALPLLSTAVMRGWIPEAPEILPDLYNDPALGGLKGDPRFHKLRDQLVGRMARERAQVNVALLLQLTTASPSG